MRNRFVILLIMVCSLRSAGAGPSDVTKACKSSEIGVVNLAPHEPIRNADLISRELSKMRGKFPKFLADYYRRAPEGRNEKEAIAFVLKANREFIPPSKARETALKYSTRTSRLADPDGYKKAVLSLLHELVPSRLNTIDEVLNIKDSRISEINIKPSSETGEFYGARSQLKPLGNSNFKIDIVFSNNESEPLFYLIPLLVHEGVHALNYREQIQLWDAGNKFYEDEIVDEARAFDVQMKTYLELANRDPGLFCNWLYVTWTYGSLPVPLSWTMASMENEMLSGKYIFNYARIGDYKDKKFLLNSDGTALSEDLQKKITALNLRYVK